MGVSAALGFVIFGAAVWNAFSSSSGSSAPAFDQSLWDATEAGDEANPCGGGLYAPCDPGGGNYGCHGTACLPYTPDAGPYTPDDPRPRPRTWLPGPAKHKPLAPACDAACHALIWLHTLEHDSAEGRTDINPGSTAGIWNKPTSTGATSTGTIVSTMATLAQAATCDIDPASCDGGGSSDKVGCSIDGAGWKNYLPTDAGNGNRATGVIACLNQGNIGDGSYTSSTVRPPGYTWAGRYVRWFAPGTDSSKTINNCHLLARQLGGSGTDLRNLATCGRAANDTVSGALGAMENVSDFEDEVADQITVDHDTVLYQVIPLYSGHRVVPYAFEMSEVWWNASGQLDGARMKLISNSAATYNGRVNIGTVVDSRDGEDVPTASTEDMYGD